MRCPKCSYVSFDFNDECPKCGKDFAELKEGKIVYVDRPQKIGIWEHYQKEKSGELEAAPVEPENEMFPMDLEGVESESAPTKEKPTSFSGDDVDLSSLGFDFGNKK